MLKTYSRDLTAKNKSGGRCQARGAQTRIQASKMQDRIIADMDKPKRTYNRVPTKSEVLDMIAQAKTAVINHPDSVPAQRRLSMLMEIIKQYK